jgi:hypothetical protein
MFLPRTQVLLALPGILSSLLFVVASSQAARADCDNPDTVKVPDNLTELALVPEADLPVWNKTHSFLHVYSPSVLKTQMQAIIVPPTGGENFLDRHLASDLCGAGILTMTLNFDSTVDSLTMDLRVHDFGNEEFLAQLEKTLRYSPRPTTLIGASLGGLYSSMAYGMASQNGFTNGYKLAFAPTKTIELLRGASLTVSGGKLAGVLADSDVGGVVAQRNLRMSTDKLTRDEYEKELEKAVTLDTLALANPKMSKNVLFFEGLFDTGVPTQYQENLWRAWGQPERERFPFGHPETIFLVYELRSCKIQDFVLGLSTEK